MWIVKCWFLLLLMRFDPDQIIRIRVLHVIDICHSSSICLHWWMCHVILEAFQNMKIYESNHKWREARMIIFIDCYDGMQMHYNVVFFCYVAKIININHQSVIRWIMSMSLNAINRVKHLAPRKTAWFRYSNSIYKNTL